MLSITMSESHKRRGHVKHDRNNRKTTEMCDRPLYEVHLFRPVLRFVLNKTLVEKKKLNFNCIYTWPEAKRSLSEYLKINCCSIGTFSHAPVSGVHGDWSKERTKLK